MSDVTEIFYWIIQGGAHSSYVLSHWIFLRALGVIYLIAFASFWVQALGLIGTRGILPFPKYLDLIRTHFGKELWHQMPTVFWWQANDKTLHAVCGLGVFFSLGLIFGLISPLCLIALWILYLSLVSIGQEFLSFQWDVLLLETGFLAIFLAPWTVWEGRAHFIPHPIVIFLFWWLAFRLTFESGIVKIVSKDPTWRNLTALFYHYETQPLPTWSAWFMHQLPRAFHKLSALFMYFAELVLPFLLFAPRELRIIACLGMILLQILILATGNYTFFNWLTIAIYLLGLDDTFWQDVVGIPIMATIQDAQPSWFVFLILPLASIVIILGATQVLEATWSRFTMPLWIRRFLNALSPFRSLNSYGLFRVMTTRRPEIIIEGSLDGQNWQAYEFRYKPGDLQKRPGFIAPHQPRLDWQMWFAALGSYNHNQWIYNLCAQLLKGEKSVVKLFKKNPFEAQPPRQIRVLLYDYRFTTWSEHKKTKSWWKRRLLGLYCPVYSHS